MLDCLTRGAYTPCAQERSGYNTYEHFGGTILIRNDDACKTVEIGNIYIKMFNGRVRTLKNVRHVPDLRKNLLSLGALKTQGYKFSVTMEF